MAIQKILHPSHGLLRFARYDVRFRIKALCFSSNFQAD